MSKFHRSIILFLLVIVVMPALLGLGCDNSGGDKIGPKVDRAVGDAIKGIGEGVEDAQQMAACMYDNKAGAIVCSGGK